MTGRALERHALREAFSAFEEERVDDLSLILHPWNEDVRWMEKNPQAVREILKAVQSFVQREKKAEGRIGDTLLLKGLGITDGQLGKGVLPVLETTMMAITSSRGQLIGKPAPLPFLLNLSQNALTDSSCQNLATLVEQSSTLMMLDLRRNHITSDGRECLLDAVARNKSVVSVTTGSRRKEGQVKEEEVGDTMTIEGVRAQGMPPLRVDIRENTTPPAPSSSSDTHQHPHLAHYPGAGDITSDLKMPGRRHSASVDNDSSEKKKKPSLSALEVGGLRQRLLSARRFGSFATQTSRRGSVNTTPELVDDKKEWNVCDVLLRDTLNERIAEGDFLNPQTTEHLRRLRVIAGMNGGEAKLFKDDDEEEEDARHHPLLAKHAPLPFSDFSRPRHGETWEQPRQRSAPTSSSSGGMLATVLQRSRMKSPYNVPIFTLEHEVLTRAPPDAIIYRRRGEHQLLSTKGPRTTKKVRSMMAAIKEHRENPPAHEIKTSVPAATGRKAKKSKNRGAAASAAKLASLALLDPIKFL